MSRLIRIDDFPHGDKALFHSHHKDLYKHLVYPALAIFEEYKIDYILGVTPKLLQDGDIDFLNRTIEHGDVVMHGYDHGWTKDWPNITDSWVKGGEFEDQSAKDILYKYNEGHKILSQVKKFNPAHYISPFNCYTQEFLNATKETNVQILHTCDKEYDLYAYENLDHHNLQIEISEYGKTYNNSGEVLNHLRNKTQITLHWIYDCGRKNYIEEYKKIAESINL